jgi:hypothetical protein
MHWLSILFAVTVVLVYTLWDMKRQNYRGEGDGWCGVCSEWKPALEVYIAQQVCQECAAKEIPVERRDPAPSTPLRSTGWSRR